MNAPGASADMRGATLRRLRRLVAVWRGEARPDPELDGVVGTRLPPGALVVQGDVSGIQDYVLTPVPGAGGAARGLRARSWTVSILAEVAARVTAERLGAPAVRPLLSGGGKFLLAIPEPPPDARERMASLERELDGECLATFGGRLVLNLAPATFRGPLLPASELREGLDARCHRRLAGALQEGGRWLSERFLGPLGDGDVGRCDACAATSSLDQVEDARLCAGCRRDEAIGAVLPRTRFLRIHRQADESAGNISLLGRAVELLPSLPESGDDVLALDPADARGSVRPFALARNLPRSDHGPAPLDFDEIALLASGAPRLGYLRIDVDRAGAAFADLGGDLARTLALSELLHGFFAVRVDELVRERFAELYVVYGGGDDLFLIGPWDRAIDFALALRADFRSLVGEGLSFSAGMVVVKPRAHVLRASELAAEALESAKDRPGRLRPADRGGRDQVNLFGVTLDWENAEVATGRAREVARWLDERRLPRGFIHSASRLHRDYLGWFAATRRGEVPDGRVRRFLPLLAYLARRDVADQKARAWADSLRQPESRDWPWFDVLSAYVGLATREGGSDQEL